MKSVSVSSSQAIGVSPPANAACASSSSSTSPSFISDVPTMTRWTSLGLSRLLEIRLEPYSHDEALELIAACSKELLAPFPPLTGAQANVVAKAACRNPRQIQAILRMLEALAGDGGDPATFQRRRLRRRPRAAADGPVPRRSGPARTDLPGRAAASPTAASPVAATMQAHLGEPHLDDTEALLIGKGLLRRTRAGRELTRDGRRRAAGIVAGSRRHLEVAS